MRKIIRTIAAAAILFGTTSGMARESKKEPKLKIDQTAKSLVIEWDAHLIKTSVKIFDKKGNVLYNDYVEDVDAYIKKFDLKFLAEGQYFLKVENSLKKVLYSFNVRKNDISISDKEETHKPVFRRSDGFVHMSFLNLGQEEVDISILDSEGTVLFEETITDSYLVGKTFDFKKAMEDDYTIIVANNVNVFYETIAVK